LRKIASPDDVRAFVWPVPPRYLASVLPPTHPQRVELNDEVHARPPEPLHAPSRVTCLALLLTPAERELEWPGLLELARRCHVQLPAEPGSHCSADFGAFRLKWERHTEFSRYVFIVRKASSEAFAAAPMTGLPADWIAALPGRLLFAAQVALVGATEESPDIERISTRCFAGHQLVGASVGGGAAMAFTDFRIDADGFSRLLVLDQGMTPNQAGRTVQSLLEIDMYRMLALLALPIARELSPSLFVNERELAEVSEQLVNADSNLEPVLLSRLTRLQAQIESHEADSHYRFGAAAAYYELVQRRIAEMREERMARLQNFREFTERRLAPAMNTCAANAARLDSLSQRVSRATQLLSTRIEITREGQNQALLASMNSRAALQLRLQGTVEGLSIAAVTYYAAGLVGYVAKGLYAAGVGVDANLATAVSIPLIALLVALGVRRIRRLVAHTT
jgi:uncharacterized membrane-anchored protein